MLKKSQMKKLIKIHMLFLIFSLTACNSYKNKISDDIASRFVKFEIVEIKRDSSSYDSIYSHYYKQNKIIELAEKTYENNKSKIILEKEPSFPQRPYIMKDVDNYFSDYNAYLNRLNSITKKTANTIDSCLDALKANGGWDIKVNEPCYIVRYRVVKDYTKDETTEIFFIKRDSVFHRPIDDGEFINFIDSQIMKKKNSKSFNARITNLIDWSLELTSK